MLNALSPRALQLSTREKITLWSQRALGRLMVVPLSVAIIALLKYRARYQVAHQEDLRRKFRELAESREPLIICTNHLTLIDSIILQWSLVSAIRYTFAYRMLFWNLPARENVRRHLSWQIITYFGKCLLVDRLGDSDKIQKLIQRVTYLLRRGEIVNIFPEGTRSRTGQIELEAVNYGVGRILQAIPGCKVLCAYLRGRSQKTYSNFPARGETFDLSLDVITPHTDKPGVRGARELSLQIMSKLKEMEAHRVETISVANGR